LAITDTELKLTAVLAIIGLSSRSAACSAVGYFSFVHRLVLLSPGTATPYVCRKNVCDLPTSDPMTFAKQLAKTEPLFHDRSPAPLPASHP
jgi:hypothetical protein